VTTATGPAEDAIAALAEPTRRLLLDRLSAHGEATASVLAGELPISRQAIVKHLAVLDRVGLVSSHRQGRERRYRVLPLQLVEAAQWMNQLAARWTARLTAIKQLAETPTNDDRTGP
jgi:DNA-binding transcriptional ArsR family regulator